MDSISERIRALRTQNKLTLKDLSEKTGLSVSFLSQVENGSSSLAITSLKKIADSLNVSIKIFFDDFEEHKYLVKKEEHKEFRLEGSNFSYARLSGDFPNRNTEIIAVTIAPNEKHNEIFEHFGEEFVYVLEGTLTITLDCEDHTLTPGDSMHYPSTLPHRWSNTTDEKTKILSMTTQTYF